MTVRRASRRSSRWGGLLRRRDLASGNKHSESEHVTVGAARRAPFPTVSPRDPSSHRALGGFRRPVRVGNGAPYTSWWTCPRVLSPGSVAPSKAWAHDHDRLVEVEGPVELKKPISPKAKILVARHQRSTAVERGYHLVGPPPRIGAHQLGLVSQRFPHDAGHESRKRDPSKGGRLPEIGLVTIGTTRNWCRKGT